MILRLPDDARLLRVARIERLWFAEESTKRSIPLLNISVSI
jgi:hypothetical protein